MREIRMLRSRRRGLETGPRTSLNGHEGGNPGYGQGISYGPPRQPPTLPRARGSRSEEWSQGALLFMNSSPTWEAGAR